MSCRSGDGPTQSLNVTLMPGRTAFEINNTGASTGTITPTFTRSQGQTVEFAIYGVGGSYGFATALTNNASGILGGWATFDAGSGFSGAGGNWATETAGVIGLLYGLYSGLYGRQRPQL